MSKPILIIIALVVVVGVIFFISNKETNAPTVNGTPEPTPTPVASASPDTVGNGESVIKEWIVEMTNDTFVPAELTIKVGDTVVFVNKDSSPHWPASGVHPTHQICQGFDSLKGIAQNETYSFTFNEAKECPMHDHVRPSMKGKIIVTE
ncbi:MAG: hypothetical protein Q8Q06_00700 [bacterium]|nr:hypothetical protein [bacterium]